MGVTLRCDRFFCVFLCLGVFFALATVSFFSIVSFDEVFSVKGNVFLVLFNFRYWWSLFIVGSRYNRTRTEVLTSAFEPIGDCDNLRFESDTKTA